MPFFVSKFPYPLNPDTNVTRAQIAVFLLKGVHGQYYLPPAVGDTRGFSNVPTSHWAAAWIKQLATEGITYGCGNGNYCPENSVTHAEMYVFLLKSKYGSSFQAPNLPPAFPDTYGHWAEDWIAYAYAQGFVVGAHGCTSGYCPNSPVNRAEMAGMLNVSKDI